MRIVVIDNDTAFNSAFSQRCAKSGVHCQAFPASGPALAEIKKSPDTVDIVLICREIAGGQGGLAVAETLRKAPLTVDIPYIITSSVWGKSEFAKHQKSQFGANAYFNKKGSMHDLEATIEAVTGFRFSKARAGDGRTNMTHMTGSVSIEVKLQAASEVVNIAEEVPHGISVEEPINLFPDGAPPPGNEPPSFSATVTSPSEAPGPVVSEISVPPVELTPFPLEIEGKGGETAVHVLATSVPVLEIPLAPEAPSAPREPDAAITTGVSPEEAARDLPYLFAGPAAKAASPRAAAALMASPRIAPPAVDVNTGGPLSNDIVTLKQYLTMREQDVSVLTAQLSYAKEELAKSEDTIKRITLQNEDLIHQVSDLKERMEKQEQELEHAGKSREGEVEQLRFEVKSRIDRIKFLEDRLKDSGEQYEKLKERVRLDIRKIRVREKELESKLEILKKDSETLIAARENKILELKRKIDLLEFNYDTLQDKNEMEKRNVARSHEKLDRVHKVLKLALGVVEGEEGELERPTDGVSGSNAA